MTGRRGGRPLVPAYLSTAGRARPSRNSLERLSVLTGLVGGTGPGPSPSTPGEDGPRQQGSAGSAPVRGVPPALDDAVPLPPGFTTPRPVPMSDPPPAPSGSARSPNPPLPIDLTPAQRSLLEVLDGGSLTVVETAALLELPVSAVRVLAGQLIDRGLVASRPPIPHAAKPRPDLLERVADGLRALKL